MRKEIVIRLQSSEKGHKKAIKVAAAVSGKNSLHTQTHISAKYNKKMALFLSYQEPIVI
ncbi:Os04g0468600 [Oryza sativa Japonica Group]|uniref:Os04g0468600 protein n=1 Tax=Oryza sativa subsp. japonica TaxID=39947 RepID=A0A0P0WBR0_ORYSJ|nr:hypothetical protein EE612_023845 [Oryza sativa]BAS89624.1 Os04g0468600 [Oryza sativa Japonica Group]